MGGRSECNTSNRDCSDGSSESVTTNSAFTKVWAQNTPYSVFGEDATS